MEGAHTSDDSIFFGPYRLDPARRELWRDDTVSTLRPKTLHVLLLLLRHAGRVVTKEEILEIVWEGRAVSEYVLTTCISELRSALGERPREPRFLETVHRTGYQLLVGERSGRVQGEENPSLGEVPRSVVGRARELGQLRAALERAHGGSRQIVFVTGEMGIGKTTLAEEFLHAVGAAARAPRRRGQRAHQAFVARGQCIEQFGAGEPYMPVLEAIGRLARGHDGALVVEALRHHAPAWLAQIPGLVSVDESIELRRSAPSPTREFMLRQIADAIEALCRQRSLVLLLEDLHLSDHSTLELVAALAKRRGEAQLLLIGTSRTGEASAASAPLQGMVGDLVLHRQAHEIALVPLSPASVDAYLAERFPGLQLPVGLSAILYQRTEGNPLFVSRLVDHLLEESVLRIQSGAKELAWSATEVDRHVPPNLRAMIEHRVDSLEPEEREALETASVAGTAFRSGWVAAALGIETEHFERLCSRVGRRIGYLAASRQPDDSTPPGGALYTFRHALYQQVLYERVGAARRERFHHAIGEALLAAGLQGDRDSNAELAFHFDRGGDLERAVDYYDKAAMHAVAQGANREAVGYLDRGLGLLDRSPDDTAHRQRRLDLLLTRGPPVMSTCGYGAAEVVDNYRRSLSLARELGNTIPELTSLLALAICELARAHIDIAEELALELVDVAVKAGLPQPFVTQLHNPLSQVRVYQGAVAESLALADAAVAAVEILAMPQPPPESRPALWADPRVLLHCQRGSASFAMGLIAQAREAIEQGLAIARELQHPFNLTYALCYLALYEDAIGHWESAIDLSRQAVEIGERHEILFWAGAARIYGGHALACSGQAEAGIAELMEGIERWRAAGGRVAGSLHLTLAADARLAAGDVAAAEALLAEAEAHVQQTGEQVFFPEILRLQAECLRRRGASVTSQESLLRRAIDMSRQHGTRLWELRSALALHGLQPCVASRDALAAIGAAFAAEPPVRDVAAVREALRKAKPPLR